MQKFDNETLRLLKKLEYQASYRGMKENEIILGRFAKDELSKLSKALIIEFEDFLNEQDNDIYDFFAGKLNFGNKYSQQLINILKLHANN